MILRWLRRYLQSRPLHPVQIPRRIVFTEENPDLELKLREARAWMRERGITEMHPLIDWANEPDMSFGKGQ